jgi:2-dehydro-3-deoxy-D-arabinonate dehydratase
MPSSPALLRVVAAGGTQSLALWAGGRLRDLGGGTLDDLCRMRLEEAYSWLDSVAGADQAGDVELIAPVESQEVWAAGVTYLRSREARMEETQTADIYARVYEAERPELFFKAPGWRVLGPGGEVGIRSDSDWDVPEPELAVLSNSYGEVLAFACGNDMSSRSIEGENPLYLAQAKVYDRSCSIGPAAVLAWHVDLAGAALRMAIRRGGEIVFEGSAPLLHMVRDPAELVRVLHSAYSLPTGAWLLTGTSIVPPPSYSAASGDEVEISIDGLGTLRNTVTEITVSGATAPPRLRMER